jgi:glycosyltransferase involved in cell wall biosynthesis
VRVLHVDHATVFGGAERSVLELARAQQTMGHDVAVAVGGKGSFSSALTDAGVAWYDMSWPEAYITVPRIASPMAVLRVVPDFMQAVRSLRRLERGWRPDVVQAHTRKAQLAASLALPSGHVPLVWHIRDDLPSRWVLRWLVALALRRADHAVALSRWLAQSYLSRHATPRSGRIGIVPSGIDAEALARLPTPWLDGDRAPVVGYVGQIARWKGPHLLVEAAEHLDATARFLVIGSVWFPAAEDEYGRWLERRLAASPAAGRVERRAASSRPEDAFEAIDILVHSSLSPEPFGRVLVEAMAARRPIVALRMGSAQELLDDSTATFAAGPDGASIARAIAVLVSDRDLARAIAERAALRSRQFAPDAVARMMDGEYRRLRR